LLPKLFQCQNGGRDLEVKMYLEVAEELLEWELGFGAESEAEKAGDVEKGVSPDSRA
jgi:hypothetical protein